MLNIRRLLFPTDFSEGSRRAFPHAASFAARHDAELYILNVTSRHRPNRAEPENFPIPADTLDDWVSTASNGKSRPDVEALSITQKQVESESPPKPIRGCVEAEDVNLVVMSTHGRRGIDRMLLGSVTEEVLHTVPCPVLTMRPDLRVIPDPVVRRILVPLDASDASETALEYAEEIARTYGAELDLLHTVEKTVYPSAYGIEPAGASSKESPDRIERSPGDRVREDLEYERVTVVSTAGYPPATVLDYVKEKEIDLVVTATHDPSETDRARLDSVAERVIQRSPVPVFTAKSGWTTLVPAKEAGAEAPD